MWIIQRGLDPKEPLMRASWDGSNVPGSPSCCTSALLGGDSFHLRTDVELYLEILGSRTDIYVHWLGIFHSLRVMRKVCGLCQRSKVKPRGYSYVSSRLCSELTRLSLIPSISIYGIQKYSVRDDLRRGINAKPKVCGLLAKPSA